MVQAVSDEMVESLEGFFGALIRPSDSDYDEARQLFNGMIDKRPALIARCQGVGDIVDAVNFARDNGYEVAVRGGGHNIAGRSTTEGGVMIDLSGMKGVHVDPAGRTVRAQGGVTWGEFNRETQLHGLGATGGIVSTTGIAGLTLGGGIGYAMGKYGLTVDNLLSAVVVTADGRVVTASEEENGDLFWALRGGGGNFGVVAVLQVPASFSRAYGHRGNDRPSIPSGRRFPPLLQRLYRNRAGRSYGLWRRVPHTRRPKDRGGNRMPSGVPRAGTKGPRATARGSGSPVMTHVEPMPYTTVNTLIDEGSPPGSLNYWKSSFVDELSDDAIDTVVDRFAGCPSPLSALVMEHMHGQATRVPETATAFAHRSPGYNLLVVSCWLDPGTTEENVAWARGTYDGMEPFLTAGRYVNYLAEDDTGDDPVRSAYGPNYDRLVQVKTKYDPTNVKGGEKTYQRGGAKPYH